MAKNKNAGKPRNYALECGVYRFGRSKMYHKKAIYKFNKLKIRKRVQTAKDAIVQLERNVFDPCKTPATGHNWFARLQDCCGKTVLGKGGGKAPPPDQGGQSMVDQSWSIHD